MHQPKRCNSILVVEDDQSIRESLLELLMMEGYHNAVAVCNGSEALEEIKHLSLPCLILLDIKMPVMDGYAFISKIEETGMKDVAHVVIMTAMPKSLTMFPNYPHMKKPIDITEFMDLINSICEHQPEKIQHDQRRTQQEQTL